MKRRKFLTRSAAIILTPGLLMPVKGLTIPEYGYSPGVDDGLEFLSQFDKAMLAVIEQAVNPPIAEFLTELGIYGYSSVEIDHSKVIEAYQKAYNAKNRL